MNPTLDLISFPGLTCLLVVVVVLSCFSPCCFFGVIVVVVLLFRMVAVPGLAGLLAVPGLDVGLVVPAVPGLVVGLAVGLAVLGLDLEGLPVPLGREGPADDMKYQLRLFHTNPGTC